MSNSSGQDVASVAKNAKFFDGNEHFAQIIDSLDTYVHIGRALNSQIAGAKLLLDVGNGGVFAYDSTLAERIVCVDLFFDGNSRGPDDRIVWRRGDALALQEPDATYDVVLESGLFHHLVGTDADATLANIRQAVAEAHRVLEQSGRLVVMESCVSPRFFALERHLFRGLRYLGGTPIMRHPATLQFPLATITEVIREQFGTVTVTPIPVGRWTNQFNLRWPSVLTPSRPFLFTATRS